jgi:ADP-ribose pyrophosphatase YjhB (NUDIX family)
VNYPSKPSAPDTWNAADKTATFVPGQSNLPAELNGIKFTDAKTPSDWSKVKGQNPAIDADMPFDPPAPGMSVGAGVIILEPDGRMWLTKPTNEFGGYKNTFPKGTVEPQLSMQQNAIKEAFEETGLQVKITGVAGDFERTTSKARFYFAERIGGSPKNMGWESQAVRLAPMKDAAKLLNRQVDKNILDEIDHLMSFDKARFFKASWERQARWPAGTPLGGQWKAVGADGITLPPKVAGGLEGKNTIYQKTVNAVHAAAQAGDHGAGAGRLPVPLGLPRVELANVCGLDRCNVDDAVAEARTQQAADDA